MNLGSHPVIDVDTSKIPLHMLLCTNVEGGSHMGENYHKMCHENIGKNVYITEQCGKRHYGRIVRVDRDHVYLQPLGRRGFSYGGFYGGYGYNWGYPIALGAVAGVALASLFFW